MHGTHHHHVPHWVENVVCKSGSRMFGTLEINVCCCPFQIVNMADLVLWDTSNCATGNTVTAYNLVSLNNNYLGTMASKVGGNLFQGHVAIGNYADVDSAIWAPGDPINSSQFPFPNNLIINSLWSGNLNDGVSGQPNDLVIYSTYAHTGTLAANVWGMDDEPVISSLSTGPFQWVGGAFIGPENFGSGEIQNLYGIDVEPYQMGIGKIDFMAGLFSVVHQQSTGAIVRSEAVGGQIQYGGPLQTASTFHAWTPYTGTGPGPNTITNLYGLQVEPHWQGGTQSYNIVSQVTNYHGQMSDRTAGNIFQGHSSFGNYGDVDGMIVSPGDPAHGTGYFRFNTVVGINEWFSGDFTAGGNTPRSLGIYTGWQHTGTASATLAAIDCQSWINSNSTGPFASVYGEYVTLTNYAGDAINALIGVNSLVTQSGSAAITQLSAVQAQAARGPGLVQNMFTVSVSRPTGTGTVQTNVGVYISDQSGIGASNYNIYSAGIASQNAFEGSIIVNDVGTPTYANRPASPAIGQIARISDSTVTTVGAAVSVGGGTHQVLAWWNGTQWTSIGI